MRQLLQTTGVAILLLLLALPQRCGGMGDKGHAGVYQQALKMLHATGDLCATGWTEYRDAERAPTNWPDGAVKYNLEFLPPPCSSVFKNLNAMNSGDHYFDPRPSHRRQVAGAWVFDDDEDPDTPEAHREFPKKLEVFRGVFKKALQGAHGTAPDSRFAELARLAGSRPIYWDKGADGIGYNAVTSILFLLNGRAHGDSTNPALLTPTTGFVGLAKGEQWKRAELAMGCAMHYVGDLATPGHTHWKSFWQLRSENIPLVDERFYAPDHSDFDHLGDSFWMDRKRHDKLIRCLQSTRPRLVYRFDSTTQVCTAEGRIWMTAPADFSWDQDLPNALLELAGETRSIWDDHWKYHGTNADFWAGDDFTDKFADRFAAHLARSVSTGAGVIDWAFARAAEKDGPYQRDATNFFGMAAGLLAQEPPGAVLRPSPIAGIRGSYTLGDGSTLQSPLDCYLGGVDQDDYFPISGGDKSRYVRVTIWDGGGKGNKKAAESGQIKAMVVSEAGLVLCRSRAAERHLELDLGEKRKDRPGNFLLRVYSPQGKKFTYSVSFTDSSVCPPQEEGMLDVLFCIDTTGSMADDIKAVQEASQEIIRQLTDYCSQNNISVQLGLVTYQDHTDAVRYAGKPEAAWLRKWPMTSNAESIRANILAIRITGAGVGGDLPEDLYAALMCAMDRRADWDGNTVDMGWRKGAAKIALVMCDAPPHVEDFEKRTLATVAARALELDPVHVYPLIMPKWGPDFLDPTLYAMEDLADATDGEVTRVGSAEQLPDALIATVKLAIRRHREELWRKENPPYALFAIAGILSGLAVLATLAAVASQFRERRRAAAAQASMAEQAPDPALTGQSATRPPRTR